MAATVDVVEGNQASVVWTVITTGRYCTSDSYNPGSANPCVVPTSGSYYSYWKHHALKLSDTFTQINNIRWFTDGTIPWTLGTGGMVGLVPRDSGDNGCPVGNYQQSTGTAGTTGDYIKDGVNGHAYYKAQAAAFTNVTGYQSGSPLTVDTTNYTTATAATKSVVTQVKLATDATQGTQGSETFTFRYDEI